MPKRPKRRSSKKARKAAQPTRKAAQHLKQKSYTPECTLKKPQYNKIAKLLKHESSAKNLCGAIEHVIPKECLGNLKVIKYLGGGEFGKILSLCKDRWECKAMKIMVANPDSDFVSADQEIALQKYAAKHGLAPKIEKLCKKGKARFIVMDKVDGILENFLNTKKQDWELDALLVEIERLMKLMCKHKMTHGDMHWGNVGYTLEFEGDMSGPDSNYVPPKDGEDDDEDYIDDDDYTTPKRGKGRTRIKRARIKRTRLYAKLMFIDFGQAHIGKCNPRLDLLQLLRTAGSDYVEHANRYNMKYLQNRLFEMYTKKYNKNMKNSQRLIETEFNKLRETYEKLFR